MTAPDHNEASYGLMNIKLFAVIRLHITLRDGHIRFIGVRGLAVLTQANDIAAPPTARQVNAGWALPSPILAIVYGAGEEADPVLARLADRLQSCGIDTAGMVQRNPEVPGRVRCNMEVEILPDGERLLISEDRGAEARGCRLDPGMLLAAVAKAQTRLAAGADILILNRFGKLEAEGGGGRDLIAAAVAQAVPVLVAVPWRNIDAFRAFAGEFASEMPIAAFEAWARDLPLSVLKVSSPTAVSFEAALARIAQSASPLGSERVDLVVAAGRVLAEPLHARHAAPRQPAAAMDGYAVVDSTTRAGMPLRVIGEAFAGASFAGRADKGEAVRIFTGAAMPAGTDRCIMQEHSRRRGNLVYFDEGYGPGWHVRGAGSDFAASTILLPAGARLVPRAMVAAAAADVATLTVAKRPTLAIIGTGDELAAPGSAFARADAIADSVTFGVAAMAETAGAAVISRQIGADCLSMLERLADDALAAADVIIVTGGASAGERDYAKLMFAASGLELVFSKVAIKPGQPVWLGRTKGKWVLGLPGNPTSAMVTARLFLLPLLARLQGQAVGDAMRWRRMPLAAGLAATGSRETFVRARWDDAGLVPLADQQSGAQAALTDADWLIRCAPGQPAGGAGDMVTALVF
jgi:molybdopterin molybdotransferase